MAVITKNVFFIYRTEKNADINIPVFFNRQKRNQGGTSHEKKTIYAITFNNTCLQLVYGSSTARQCI